MEETPRLGRVVSGTFRLFVAFLVAFPPSVWSNPSIGSVVSGSATIGSSGNTTTIVQLSNNAIINWQGFSIARGETTNFIQPSALSAVLNRVTGGDPSSIYGTLAANGKVFLINPNGIVVGPSGVINTQSFVASTLDVDNAQFMAGGSLLFSGSSLAGIINAGKINALGGDILMFAHTVQNTGELNAAGGTAALAAGSEVLFQPGAGQQVFVKAGAADDASATGVDQKGQIEAAAVELKAAGGNVYGLAINNSGTVRATEVVNRGGRVYLEADGGAVVNSGELTAKAGDQGGTVQVVGGDITLKSGSLIDASGANGGGTVLVGGDSQGLNPAVADANAVTVEAGATIKADATTSGNGGKVVVWSNDATSYKGTITAQGGAVSGDAGSAEVSGGYLDFNGVVKLTAANGAMGTLLLDPFDITIQNTGTTNTQQSGFGGNLTDTSNTNSSILTVATLTGQLANSNVTVQTGNGGGQQGNITVANAVAWTSNSNLTLRANNNITTNAGATISNTGNGGVTMTANSGGGNNGATITLNAGVTTAGGSQNYTSGSNGAINLNANNTSGSGSQNYNNAVNLQANETLTTTSGNVAFNGTVNGGKSLTVTQGSGNTTFSGSVGNTAQLTSLSIAGSGTTNLNGSVTTAAGGSQTYGEAVNLNNSATLTSNGGAVSFNGTVNGGNALTVNAGAGNVTFGGTLGGTSQLDALSISGSGTTNLNGGNITTNGTNSVVFGEKVVLGANTAIATNGGDVTFSGAVDGAKSLSVNGGPGAGGGNITLSGAVGAGTALTSLSLSGSGTTALNGGAVTTASGGSQTYGQTVTLGANTTLTSNGGTISLTGGANGVTTGGQSLTIAAGAGGVSLGNLGTNRQLASVTDSGTGVLTLNGTVNTAGAQSYSQQIVLAGNSGLTTGNAAITLNNTVNGTTAGGQSLTLNSGSAATNLNAAVGGTTRLGALSVSGSGTTNLNAGTVNSGAETFNGPVVLDQNTTLNSNGGTVDFGSTVNGAAADAQSLTVNAGNGAVSFSNVGATNRLTSVSLTGTGGLTLNGTVNTLGAQSYAQAITLAGNSALTTSNAAVTLGGSVDAASTGNQGLTINAGSGNVSLSNVGTNRQLSSFVLNNTGTLFLNGTVNTSQAQTYAQNIVLNGNSGLTTNNQAITLNGTVNGATAGGQSLTLNSGTNQTNLNNSIGATTRIGAFTTNGSGTTNLNVATLNTGAETFNQALKLSQNTVLNSNGGAVAFNGAVNGAAADAQTLTVNAGAGNVNLGNVGTTTRLQSLAINGATIGLNGTVNTNAAQTYSQAITLNGNSTLTTNNAGITLNGTVNGGNSLTLNGGTGNVNINGQIGNTSAIDALTITGTGATNLNTAAITTNGTGDQTYGEAVNLLQNTTLTTNGGNVVFSKTVDGAKNLSIDTTNGGGGGFGGFGGGGFGGGNDGDVTFGGAVGGGTALASLLIDDSNVSGNQGSGGGGTIHINGAVVDTNGAQTYGDQVILGANTTLNSNGGALFFNDHLNATTNGAQSLVINAGAGNVFFNRHVGGDARLSLLTINGTGVTDIDTGGVDTVGAQTYNENITLTNSPNLTTTNGSIVFNGTINGAQDLGVSAAGTGATVTFNKEVGGTTALSSLDVASSGNTILNGGTATTGVKTTGSQTYENAVVLGTNNQLTATSNGSISFGSTLNASPDQLEALTAVTGGVVTFNGVVGGTNKLAALTVSGSGTTNINTSAVNTTGAQNYNATTLSKTATLTSSNGGAIDFNSTLNAASDQLEALTATTGGVVLFNGVVGGSRKLAALTTNGSGTTNINTTAVNTTGAQNYNETTVSQNATLTATNGPVNFNATVDAATDGVQSLTVTDGGVTSFNGVVGGTKRLAALTTNGSGSTNINTTAINTTGAQNYDATTVSQNAVLTAANGPVSFNSTLNAATDGVQSLTVTDGGVTSFNGIVGGSKRLAALTTNGAGTTNINTTAINTTGAQSFDATTVSQNATLTASNGPVNFNATVNAATDGVQSLTVTDGGVTSFNGIVGGSKRLSALTTNGAGSTNINTTAINTTGAQNYDATTVSQNATLTAANGPVNFNATLNAAADGVQSLIVTDGGATSFNGVVGGTSRLSSLTTNGSGTTNINTTAINTTGAQNYDATTVSQNATLTAANGPVNFNSTLNAATDGVQSLTVTDGGVTSFNGVVGGSKRLSALTTNGSGSTNINTTAINTTGAQNYDAATVSQNAVLTAANGPVNFNATLDAATDGVQSLTVTDGGVTSFNGVVGGTKRLSALTTNGAGSTNINTTAINTTGAQNYDATTVSQNATLTAANGPVNFNSTLNAATDGVQSVTVTDGGVTSFDGVVGGSKRLSTLTTNGAGSTNINTTAINTTGAQNYDATTVSQNATLTASNGPVNFNATVNAATDGAQGLTVTDGGVTSFNGIVGGSKRLAALTTNGAGSTNINTTAINTTGAQNYDATTVSQNAVLTAATGAIDFNATVDAASNGAQSLTAVAGGVLAFDGPVGGNAALAALTGTAGGGIDLNGQTVTTTGDQDYKSAVVLGTDDLLTTTGAGKITFESAVSGPYALTTNSVGNTDFDGAVNIGSLDATTGGFIDLNNGLVTTSGSQLYHSAVQLGADNTLTGSAITFNGPITGAHALTTNSTADTAFNGVVNIGSLDATAGGFIDLNNGLVTTSGAQLYRTAVQLGADNTLTGSAVTFNGPITGAHALTTNSTNDTAFNGSVNIGSLDATAGGFIDLNNGLVTTSGAQLYHSAVLLGADNTLTGSAITFNGPVTGAHALITNSTNDTAFNGSVNIGSLDATAGGFIDLNNGLVTTSGAQLYRTAVQLGADNTITGSAITFDGAVNGAYALTTNSTNDTAFNGAVNIGSLDATAANVDLNAGTVVTANDQAYHSPVNLLSDESLTSTSGRITFDSTLTGPFALTTNSGLATTFDGILNIGSLDATAAGGIALNGGQITTNGAQTYHSAVLLGADSTLNSNGGTVAFDSTVDGAQSLTINAAAGDVDFYAPVGQTTPLTGLAITGTGVTDLNGGALTTNGSQSYGEKVVLSADAYLTSNGGDVTFWQTVDGTVAGQQGLTVDSGAGVITFYGNIGATVWLKYLTLIGTGAQNLYGTVDTVANQDYWDDLFLLADLTLRSHGGYVTFHKTVNGTHNLTVDAATGDITFDGLVGNTAALLSLDLLGTGTTHLNGGAITTNGLQHYGESVALGADTVLTSNGGAVTFDGSINGAQSLTVATGAGDITFGGAVGDAAHLTSLDLTGTGTTHLNGGVVNTDGTQTYGEKVVLGADDTLSSNGGLVTFAGTVNGAQNLIVDAGDIDLKDAVGDVTPLASLALNGSGVTTLEGGAVTTSGAQTYGETAQLGADSTLTGSAITFSGPVTGAHALNTDSTVDTTFNGVLNTASLDATAGGLIDLNDGLVTTSGAQIYNGTTQLGADNTLSGSAITFNGAINGGHALTTNSTADTAFNGAVDIASLDATAGGAIDLNAGTIVTSGDQVYHSAVNLTGDDALTGNNITFLSSIGGAHALTTDSTVDTTFDGAVNTGALDATAGGLINLNEGLVTTSGAQTYNGAVQLGAANTLTGSAITVNGPINGAYALTTNSTNDTAFNGAIAIASLDATAGGLIDLDAGTIVTSGDQVYHTAVALTGADSLTGNSLSFMSSVSGANSLTTNSTLDTTFGGAVNIGSLDATAGGLIDLNNGLVTTSAAQVYHTAVQLGADNALTGSALTFDGAVTGAYALNTNSTVDTTFNGVLNTASLDATAGGLINLNDGPVTTSGAQTYNGATQLGADNALSASAITFNGSINGSYALTTNSTNDTAFNGAVNIGSLDATAGGLIDLNAGTIVTSGAQLYHAAVALTGDDSLTASAITFDSTITGAHGLTTNSTADTAFDGVVNIGSLDATAGGLIDLNNGLVTTAGAQTYRSAVSAPGAIDLTAGGLINLDGGSVVSVGAQTYDGATQLGADDTVTGSAITFNGAINGAHGLTTNSTNDTAFNGAVNIGSLDATAANIDLNAGTIVTSGDQVYRSPVTLVSDQSLTSSLGNISFLSSVGGAKALTTGSALDTTFDGVLNTASLDATAGGLINLNDGLVTTSGAQIYNGATQLGTDNALNGSAITFNGAINGAHALTTNSANDTAFNGAVNIASLDATAANIDLNAGTIATSGGQVYHSAVALTGDDSLTASAITFDAAISGGHSLTTNSTADTAFGGVVNIGALDATAGGLIDLNDGVVTTAGAQTYRSAVYAPGAMDLTAGGLIGLDGGSVVSVGAQTYNGATQLGADDTLSASDITFNGAIGGAHGLTTASTNDTAFNGAVNVGSLDATAANIDLNAGTIATSGGQVYHSAVALTGDDSLTGSAITFDAAISGAHALTTNSTADTAFDGVVNIGSLDATAGGLIDLNNGLVTTVGAQTYRSAVSAPGAIDLSAGGLVNLNGGSVVSVGAQTYDGATQLGADDTLTGSAITFNGVIDGAHGLTTNSSNDTTFNGAVNIGALDASAGGLIDLNAGLVTTNGAQSYHSAVSLLSDTTLNSNGGTVKFDTTVDGAQTLIINAAAGDIDFLGAVGQGTALTGLTLTGTGTTDINGGFVTTNGAQSYGEKVVLSADGWLASNGGNIDFLKTVDGTVAQQQGLTVDGGAGAISFYGDIGSFVALKYLTLLGTGAKNLYGTVYTGGDQIYANDLFLFADLILHTGGGNVLFMKTVNGGHLLGIDAGAGNITFDGLVGNTVPLSGLNLTGTGTTSLNGGAVTTTGAQSYGEKVALGVDNTLTSQAGGVSFGSTINGAHSLTVASGAGDVTFDGAVGDQTALTGLTLSGSGTTDMNGGTVDTNGDQTYGENVALGGNTVLASNGGQLSFDGSVDGAHDLTVNAGAGNINFYGAVGNASPLTSLTLNGSGTTDLNGGVVNTNGSQTYNEKVSLSANDVLTSNGGAVTFAGTVNGGHDLTVISGAGTISLNGAIGDSAHLTSLTLNGSVADLNGGVVNTDGAQTYAADAVLGADTVLSSNGGALDFAGTVNGAHTLTVNAGAGNITFGGAVGDTTHLNSLTLNGSGTTAVNGGAVTTTGAQSYGESVALGADTTFTTNGGAATFAGSVAGPHALTVLTGLGAITLNGAATVGDIDLEGGRVSWNDTLSGTGAKIFGGDILMNGDVDTTGANGVLMVAGHSFQNIGAKAINPTGSRWLIYSIDPTLDVKGGLTGAVQWSTDYLLGPLPNFLGNGFLYKDAAPVPPNPTLGDFNPGANGAPGLNQNGDNTHAGVISDGSDTNDGTSSNWSASTGDLFNWDTGSLNDALNDDAPGDDSSDPKKKKQPKK